MAKEQTLPIEPLPPDTLNAILEDFYRNGVTIVRNVLSREECKHIVARVNEIFAEPYFLQMRNVKGNRQDGKTRSLFIVSLSATSCFGACSCGNQLSVSPRQY